MASMSFGRWSVVPWVFLRMTGSVSVAPAPFKRPFHLFGSQKPFEKKRIISLGWKRRKSRRCATEKESREKSYSSHSRSYPMPGAGEARH